MSRPRMAYPLQMSMLAAVASCAASIIAYPAAAAPITLVDEAFLKLNDTWNNDLGFGTGLSIQFGEDSVVPNGDNGTTATAQTTNLSNGSTFTHAVAFQGDTALPNFFSSSIAYDPNLVGPWTVTFSNSVGTANTVSVTPGSLIGVTPPPPASNVTISGSSTNPTFSWTYPSGSIAGVFINIFDKSMKNAAGGPDLVFATPIRGTTGSFTVPSTLAGGLSLENNHTYTLQVVGVVLRNPSGPLLDGNALTTSASFFDFTPTAASPQSTVYLPTITANGVYDFNLTVQPNTTYDMDPAVATGFAYAIGAGDPNFATVVLPELQGSEPYAITWDGGLHSEQILGGDVLNFLLTDVLGVDAFTVTGIDPSDGLDPSSGTEFITGLTFVAAGTFTGTMTPITSEVPEPSSLALFLAAVIGLGLMCRLPSVKKISTLFEKSTRVD